MYSFKSRGAVAGRKSLYLQRSVSSWDSGCCFACLIVGDNFFRAAAIFLAIGPLGPRAPICFRTPAPVLAFRC